MDTKALTSIIGGSRRNWLRLVLFVCVLLVSRGTMELDRAAVDVSKGPKLACVAIVHRGECDAAHMSYTQ
jgi:hypothetical protein